MKKKNIKQRNFVAEYSRVANSVQVFIDRKKEFKKNNYNTKYKKIEDYSSKHFLKIG